MLTEAGFADTRGHADVRLLQHRRRPQARLNSHTRSQADRQPWPSAILALVLASAWENASKMPERIAVRELSANEQPDCRPGRPSPPARLSDDQEGARAGGTAGTAAAAWRGARRRDDRPRPLARRQRIRHAGCRLECVGPDPNADGSRKTTELAGMLWKATKSTTFDGQMVDLEAGTMHRPDRHRGRTRPGNESRKHQTFKTHRRFVTVTVSKIFVINDSDP